MTVAPSAPLTAVWTRRHRRLLGKLFDAAAPDLEGGFALTRELIARLGDAIPSVHDGIALMPLLEHKLAGYNADLFAHAVRLARADGAAKEFLARGGPRRFRSAFSDMYLAEHCVAERLEASGGRFAATDQKVVDRTALAERYRPRCLSPGYQPLEVRLNDQPDSRDVPPHSTAHARDGVLFVASMNNYLNPMVPVVRRLVEMGRPPLVLLPAGSDRWPAGAELPMQARRLIMPGPETPELTRVFAAQRRRYAELWDSHGAEVTRCFRVGAVDLWPLVGADIEKLVKDYFAYAIACIELARALVDRLGVASVALARLRRATESALAAGFRSRGVPVTMIVHGHVSNFPERRFDAGGFSGADRVCVWGAHQARQVMESAWPPQPGAVVAVGNPAWDPLVSQPKRDRAALRRALSDRLKIEAGAVWAVLTSQTLALEQFTDVVEAFKSKPGAVLIVKVHPAEDPAWYRARLDGLPSARVLPHAEIDLHALLCAADMTLTFSSTTNLESLLLGTPVVTYVFGALAAQDRAVYLEQYGLPLARRTEELSEILRRAINDPVVFRQALAPAMNRAVVENLANHDDAGASEQVASVLLEPRRNLR